MTVAGRRISPNANALRFSLQSDIPELYKGAKDAISKAWGESQSVAQCAKLLGIHRNTCLKLLVELKIYDERMSQLHE